MSIKGQKTRQKSTKIIYRSGRPGVAAFLPVAAKKEVMNKSPVFHCRSCRAGKRSTREKKFFKYLEEEW